MTKSIARGEHLTADKSVQRARGGNTRDRRGITTSNARESDCNGCMQIQVVSAKLSVSVHKHFSSKCN